ncbi:MAG: hypothetical protein WC838_06485, partial [Candidatus Margulisiibacteriota bacterium]
MSNPESKKEQYRYFSAKIVSSNTTAASNVVSNTTTSSIGLPSALYSQAVSGISLLYEKARQGLAEAITPKNTPSNNIDPVLLTGSSSVEQAGKKYDEAAGLSKDLLRKVYFSMLPEGVRKALHEQSNQTGSFYRSLAVASMAMVLGGTAVEVEAAAAETIK